MKASRSSTRQANTSPTTALEEGGMIRRRRSVSDGRWGRQEGTAESLAGPPVRPKDAAAVRAGAILGSSSFEVTRTRAES